jgi:hypothetical protein
MFHSEAFLFVSLLPPSFGFWMLTCHFSFDHVGSFLKAYRLGLFGMASCSPCPLVVCFPNSSAGLSFIFVKGIALMVYLGNWDLVALS